LSKTTRRCTLALIASIALMALLAAPAWAAPDPAYTVAPSPPRCGDAATYTDNSTVDAGLAVAKVEWDFDNDGAYEVVDEAAPFSAPHTYTTRGTKTFGMRVTDNMLLTPGVTAEDQTVSVVTASPQASFTPSDTSPFVGDDVLFAAETSDADGDAIAAYAWDFDSNGTTDSTVRNPIHKYTQPGPKTISLRVTDACGAQSAAAVRDITVSGQPVPGNALPVANFVFSPRTARVGDPVTFASSAFDPEGPLQEQTWDLDGDGQFDDGRGAEVVYTYTTAGMRAVRLRATDGAGQSVVREELLRVEAAPKPPPGFLRPAPNVRFNGLILARGTRIRILSVRAPRGSIVAVRCKAKGKRCPAKLRRKRVKKSTVRFKTFERFLRAGTRLEIYVRKANTIGAFTRYTIRAGKGPVRVDRCLPAGASTKPKKRCG
jgi:PKD repeat protein